MLSCYCRLGSGSRECCKPLLRRCLSSSDSAALGFEDARLCDVLQLVSAGRVHWCLGSLAKAFVIMGEGFARNMARNRGTGTSVFTEIVRVQLAGLRSDCRHCMGSIARLPLVLRVLLLYGVPLAAFVALVSLGATMASVQYSVPRAPALPLYEQLFDKAVHCLDGAQQQYGGEWWIGGSTLAASLRFGAPYPDYVDPEDVYDNTLTFMYGTETEAKWDVVRTFLVQQLAHQGYRRCEPKATLFAQRVDSLVCAVGGGLLEVETARVVVQSYMRPNPDHAAFASFAYTHRRAPARHEPSFGGHVYFGTVFKAWGGRLPLSSIMPLQSCKFFRVGVPCPARPVEVLAGLLGMHTGDCVAFPVGVSEEEQDAISQYAHDLHAAGIPSVYAELHQDECESH